MGQRMAETERRSKTGGSAGLVSLPALGGTHLRAAAVAALLAFSDAEAATASRLDAPASRTVAQPPTPAGQASAALETVTDADGTWVWAPAWAAQAEDPQLVRGLQLASTYNQQWRELVAPYLAGRGTHLAFGPLPEGAGGMYDPRTNRITLNDTVRGETPGVIAALLAHEVYHAVVVRSIRQSECLDEEQYAFSWQASTWAYLPEPWRGRGRWAHWHDHVAGAWRDRTLAETVVALPGDRLQCSAWAQQAVGSALPPCPVT
jgi:hypothetical protein